MTIVRGLVAVCVIAVGCGVTLAQAPVRTPTAEAQPQNVLKIKTTSNIKNDRMAAPKTGAATPAPVPVDAAKVKSHSNQANNRAAQARTGSAGAVSPAPVPVDAEKVKSQGSKNHGAHVGNVKWTTLKTSSQSGAGATPSTAPAPKP